MIESQINKFYLSDYPLYTTYNSRIASEEKGSDDINAVFNGFGTESLYHGTGVMLVSQNILSPEEHLELCVGQGLSQLPQALPWIFVKKAHTGVKRRAAPVLWGSVANGVQHFTGKEHILQPHACGPLSLMGATQDGISNI